MKAFLLYLWVGGTILYALNALVLHLWFAPTPGVTQAIVEEPKQTSLPSWTSHLPEHQVRTQSAKPSPVLKEASVTVPASVEKPISKGNSTNAQFEGLGNGSSERVVVILGAYVHKEPIVSSPIEKRYPIGTDLELISRSDGWAQVRNPISKHTGWVLEQHYLAPAKSASTQVAIVEPEDQPSVSTKPKREATKNKRKFAPRSRELADGDFSFGWDPRRPRWNKQWETRRQGRPNWRRDRAFLFGPP